ncbi:helix-turn-helix domain-containing protein [Reichenbachiella sp.]|uniref:helix-turn-helix domain-containing protein n=1 Tax=Reichenbachiella sp. TaxID=2184521 RepID=UPI003297EA06
MILITAILFSAIVSSIINIALTSLSTFHNKNFLYGVIGYFSCLLIMFAEHLVEYAGYSCSYTFTIFISAIFYLLLAPFLNVIINSIFNRPVVWSKFLLEALPALIYLILMIPFYQLSGEAKCQYLAKYVDHHWFGSYKHKLLVWSIVMQTSIYAYTWFKKFRNYSLLIKSKASSSEIEFIPWISRLLGVIILFTSSVFLTWLARLFYPENYYLLDKSENVVLAFIPYVFLFLLFFLPEKPFPALDKSSAADSNEKGYDPLQIEQLAELMQRKKLYLNADLSLADVANQLNISRHALSNLLSQGVQKNFYDFVNEYRIAHAIQLMDSDMLKTFSLSGIARESGFNNYVSFFRVFKRLTELTPSAYIKEKSLDSDI